MTFQIVDAPTRRFMGKTTTSGRRSYVTEASNYRDDIGRTMRIIFRDSRLIPNHPYETMRESSGKVGHVYKEKYREERGWACPGHTNPQQQTNYSMALKNKINLEFKPFKHTDEIYLEDRGFHAIDPTSDIRKLTPSLVKSIIKPYFSNIEYATEASGILNASLSSESDSNKATMAILEAEGFGRGGKKYKRAQGLPMKVNSHTLELEVLGCPFFDFGQQYFIDFYTGTTMDALYRVASVSHSVSPGEFKTKLILKKSTDNLSYESSFSQAKAVEQQMAYTTYRNFELNKAAEEKGDKSYSMLRQNYLDTVPTATDQEIMEARATMERKRQKELEDKKSESLLNPLGLRRFKYRQEERWVKKAIKRKIDQQVVRELAKRVDPARQEKGGHRKDFEGLLQQGIDQEGIG